MKKQDNNKTIKIILDSILVVIIFLSYTAYTEGIYISSTNYAIIANVISIGGNAAKDTTRRLRTACLGEVSAITKLSHSTYTLYTAYLNLPFRPRTITDLTVSQGVYPDGLELRWTAPGTDDDDSNSNYYVVKYATYPIITQQLFSSASTYMQDWTPLPAGSVETKTITIPGLTVGVTYYVSIEAQDGMRNQGFLSNETNYAMELDFTIEPSTLPQKSWDTSSLFNIHPTSITIKNTGNAAISYILSCSSTAALEIVPSTPTTATQFRMMAKFNSVPPTSTDYNVDLDTMTLLPQQAGPPGGYYAGNQTGNSVAAGESRSLWISLCASTASTTTPQTTNISISVGGITKLVSYTFTIVDDTTPPAAVTNLSALPSTVHAAVKLSWTAPGDDENVGAINPGTYAIQYATWTGVTWSTTAAQVRISTSWVNPGDLQSYTVTGLDITTTYYFQLWTADNMLNWSGMSNQATSYPGIDTLSPAIVTNLTVSRGNLQLTLQWTAPGDDGNTGCANMYDIRYSTTGSITSGNWSAAKPVTQLCTIDLYTTGSAGTPETRTVTNLSNGTTYWFALKTVDDSNNWSEVSNSIYGIPLISPPKLTQALHRGTTVDLSWENSDDRSAANFKGYNIYRKDSPTGSFNKIASLLTGTTHQDTSGISSAQVYYYYLRTQDTTGIESDNSNTLEAIYDDIKPLITEMTELSRIELIGDIATIKTTVTDNRAVDKAILWYRYKSTTGWSAWVSTTAAGTGIGSTTFTGKAIIPKDVIRNAKELQYYLQANDINANYTYSLTTPTVSISREALPQTIKQGKVELADGNLDDGAVYVDIPYEALDTFITISIIQENAQKYQGTENIIDLSKNSAKPVCVFTFYPENITFNKPVQISLLYFDTDNNGTVEKEDGSDTDINENTSLLQIYYWDGIKWRLMAGSVNKETNAITCKVNKLGKYALFARGTLPDKLTPEEKFITPNTPAVFGPKAEKVSIYDTAGGLILELTKDDFAGGIISWAGRDKSGNMIESGAYIYKIRDISGKEVYGIGIIAK